MKSTILIPIALLAGCATAAAGPDLRAAEWRAVDVNGAPVAGDRPLTLRLADAGQASGNSGCNSFTGTYKRRSQSRIDFGPLASTRMACEPAIMDQERRYLAILDAAERYTRYGDGSLSIIAPDGSAVRYRPVR